VYRGSLLDELPYAAANLTDAPEHVKAGLYNAFDIHALYRQPMKQATIWATITDDTPAPSPPCSPTPAPTPTHLETCSLPLWRRYGDTSDPRTFFCAESRQAYFMKYQGMSWRASARHSLIPDSVARWLASAMAA
jgi:hypothetical protein